MHSPFDLRKPIAIGSDHAGFELKEDLISFLEGKGLTYTDFGTHTKDSVDYPDFAHPVASAVEQGEAAFGILLCGSANGVAITCLLYTSDAADERSSVDLGGRRIIKKKKKKRN